MENPTFRLEGVIRSREEMQDFEGPLTLILLLLSKNKIEIRDIRISEILDQYLAWMDEMQRMDLDVASEFVQMASHLVYIKTKTLLAGTEEVSELEILMSSLEQLRMRDAFSSLKETIPILSDSLAKGSLLFSTPQEPMPRYGEYDYHHEPWELLNAIASMLRKGVPEPEEETRVRAVPRPLIYSVREKGRELIGYLKTHRTAALTELYRMASSRSELVATFLSLLEMCAMGSVLIAEDDGEYTVSFSGDDSVNFAENSEYG